VYKLLLPILAWDDATIEDTPAKSEPKVEEQSVELPVEESIKPQKAETKKAATPQREKSAGSDSIPKQVHNFKNLVEFITALSCLNLCVTFQKFFPCTCLFLKA
jgi:hypothetical protein